MTDEEIEKAEEEYFYSPEKGNVAFTSALDNWGFTLDTFAPKIAQQLGGMRPRMLVKYLWGKFYYIVKDKKLTKVQPNPNAKPLFVKYVLEPLILEYRKIFTDDIYGNTAEMRNAHNKIKAKLSKFVPIDNAIFSMVVDKLPSPEQGQPLKVNSLSRDFKTKKKEFLPVRNAISTCKLDEPIIVYVTKMQPFSSRIYDIAIRASERSDTNQKLVAIARVYSGTLRVGSKVWVFGATHSQEKPDVTEVEIPYLFLLMGQNLQCVDQVGPGCIIGIGGLENILLKTGTISSTMECPNFSKLDGLSKGLVKVTVMPAQLSQYNQLIQGLTQMSRADPSVEFHVNKQGENILSTCGEVHLEKCIKDLQDDYAPGVEIEIGEPIIPFKETIVNRTMREKAKKEQKVYEELNSSSESEDEDANEEDDEMKDEMTLIEFLEKQEEMKQAREILRKEQ